MEKSLEKHLEETFKIPGVINVMCVDDQGLNLGSRGPCPLHASGAIAAIAKQASELRRSNTQNQPSICIESETGSVLIGHTDDITMAIFKSS